MDGTGMNHDDDTDGWMYAQDFDSKVWYSTATALSMVRRRVHTRSFPSSQQRCQEQKVPRSGLGGEGGCRERGEVGQSRSRREKAHSGGIPHNLLVNSRELGFVDF